MHDSLRRKLRHPVFLVLALTAVLALPGIHGCSDTTLPHYVPPDDDGTKDTNVVGMQVYPVDVGDVMV